MLVSAAKYRKLELELYSVKHRLNLITAKWNDLVEVINRKGGQAFLDQMPKPQFTESELKTLLQLCHPDKHGGKDSAVRITQKLLELRK